ncbi:MAG: hypothetical protein AAFY33_01165 [Cyanobacteria bacterium J06643_4]
MTEDTHPYLWAVIGPPIGHWKTTSGTFENVMQSHFTFNQDGTGELCKGNAFGLDAPLPFRWRHVSPGELRVFVLYPDISETEHAMEIEDETNWDSISYMADVIHNDLGSTPVLRDIKSTFPDTFPISFWDTHFAITLKSDKVSR